MSEFYKVYYKGLKPNIDEHKEGNATITNYQYSDGTFIIFKKSYNPKTKGEYIDILQTNKKIKHSSDFNTFILED